MIELRLGAIPNGATPTPRELYWHISRGSFFTSVDPNCTRLGTVPAAHQDFVRVATAVYLADRNSKRRGWARTIHVSVPVRAATVWTDESAAFADILNFLTGDDWHLYFAPDLTDGPAPVAAQPGVVYLFSGGADSFSGAALHERHHPAPLLVRHWEQGAMGGQQKEALTALATLTRKRQTCEDIRLSRRARQPHNGARFEKEPTSRARSLLFIALGLAAAGVRGESLAIAENGFLSLNVPLAAERQGALSTRTTHPAFLDRLAVFLPTVGVATSFSNPLERMTKGEVFAELARTYGAQPAGLGLSATHSCAKTNSQFLRGVSSRMACGVCFACLVRRGAFRAAGLEDPTPYVESSFQPGTAARRAWLAKHGRDVQAVRYAVRRGVDERDVLALGLPERVAVADALQIARKGLQELGAINVADA